MKSQIYCAVIAVLFLGNVTARSQESPNASEHSTLGPIEPGLVVHLDLGRFAKSDLGGLLIKAGTNLAAEELQKDPQEAMEAVVKSLGFDPLDQDIKLTVTIPNVENPIDGFVAVAVLKDTTGNFEGFLLAAPNYQGEKHQGHTIHQSKIDGKDVSVAITDSKHGSKIIVASSSSQAVVNALGQVDQRGPSNASVWSLTDKEFANVDLRSLPGEWLRETPASHLAELIQDASLSMGEADDSMQATLRVTADDEERATQLQQLAQGVTAMAGLFKDEIRSELGEQGNADAILSVMDSVSVERDARTVSVVVSLPKSLIITFLREEADLPL